MFKLFSKKKEKTEIRFSDVREFIMVNTEKEFSTIEKKAEDIIDELMKESCKLKGQLKELEEIKTDNSFSNNVKNKYCERCLALFSLYAPKTSFSELSKFIDTLKNINKSVNNLTLKEFKHMKDFKAKMSRISLQTKIIDRKSESFKNLIKGSVLEKREKMKKCLDWIDEINHDISSFENEINETQSRKQDLENEIQSLENQLDIFKKDGLQDKFNEEMKDIEALEKQRDMIKQNIETEFGGIIRPLKKLQYASDSGEVALLKEEKNMLVQYLESPDTFLITDNKIVIQGIINQIKDLAGKNVIELNKKESEKVLGIYSNLNFLISLKNQYNDLVSRIRAREEKVKNIFLPFAETKKKAQFDIEKKRNEIERLNNDTKRKEEEIDKLKKKITTNILAFESMLDEFLNIEAKIVF